MTPWTILDISTAPLADVANYLTPAAERTPPSNYSKADSIAKWQAADYQDDWNRASLDADLGRITGLGVHDSDDYATVLLAKDLHEEAALLSWLAEQIRRDADMLITFNGRTFDLPFAMRRARYLDVPFPSINVDRYRSPNADLCELLASDDGRKKKSLNFYVRRLGWTDLVKPVEGRDEARVFETGDWDGLKASIARDVEATYRLAQWAKVIR